MANVLPQVVRLRRIALDLLFPKWCIGCGREGEYLCPACRETLLPIMPPLCPRCGRPQEGGMLCPACAGWLSAIDGIRSPFRFGGVIRRAIHELKYRNLRAISAPLAGLLYDYLGTSPLTGDVLVPVPLHRKRLRERGYNQSGLLARELGKLTGLPVVDSCLVRQQHTPPQVRAAGVDERHRQIAGAFACNNGALRGKKVILVDDVFTSGATLEACAGALKSTGAASVWGLAVAADI